MKMQAQKKLIPLVWYIISIKEDFLHGMYIKKKLNKTAALNKTSQVTYFREGCAGGNNTQKFGGPTTCTDIIMD